MNTIVVPELATGMHLSLQLVPITVHCHQVFI